MRILHINDRLSSRGGADIHLHGILTHLAEDHGLFLRSAIKMEPYPLHAMLLKFQSFVKGDDEKLIWTKFVGFSSLTLFIFIMS